jgi:hypothetical protein
MKRHKQVKCFNPWKYKNVLIDEEIAPLIQAIWDLDVQTINSCQEYHPGIMWIEFKTSNEFEKFLNFAIPNRDGDLWESAHIKWDLTASVSDVSFDIVDDQVNYRDPPEYEVYVSARFPVKQYKEILKNVLAYSNL